jgi:hypothetical protein
LLSLLDIAADIWDNCSGMVMVITKLWCRLDGIAASSVLASVAGFAYLLKSVVLLLLFIIKG